MIFCDRRAKWLLCLLSLMACGTPRPPPVTTTSAGTTPADSRILAEAKMASSLHSVVQRMRQDGVTAANVTTRQAESYTTPLVRVDHTGRIQAVVLVTAVEEWVASQLEVHRAHIEIADAELRLIQAWIPFDRLEEIAALPFVRYIRPPSYAMRRAR